MKSLLEIKTPIRSIARSYILTTPESSNIGILEVHLYLYLHLYVYLKCSSVWIFRTNSALIDFTVVRVTGFG